MAIANMRFCADPLVRICFGLFGRDPLDGKQHVLPWTTSTVKLPERAWMLSQVLTQKLYICRAITEDTLVSLL